MHVNFSPLLPQHQFNAKQTQDISDIAFVVLVEAKHAQLFPLQK